MNRYIISLGSNIPSGKEEVERAIARLDELGEIFAATPTYTTPDAYHPENAPYTNAIAIVGSEKNSEDLNRWLKAYEASRGRVPKGKQIPIDLDLVCCGSEILRPKDYNAPYFVSGLHLLSAYPQLSAKSREK